MTYHHKDEHKQIDRYRVKVSAIPDTIRSGIFKKCVLENVDNDRVFTKTCDLLVVLKLHQYRPDNKASAHLVIKGIIT